MSIPRIVNPTVPGRPIVAIFGSPKNLDSSIMSDIKPIVFYDIPAKTPDTPWSPNTWKTRYCLNTKKLSFTTVWVEYPDIETTVKDLGGKPTSTKPDGSPHYTLPVIQDPNTSTVVADSFEIAKYLDKTYTTGPSLLRGLPALHLGFLAGWRAAVGESLFPLCLPLVPEKLNKVSEEYWWPTRKAILGMPLPDYYPKGEKLPETWKALEEGFGKVASWYQDGPVLIDGEQPTFMDTSVAGNLYWIRWVYGPESEEWKKIATWHGGRWAALLERMKEFE